MTRGRTLEKCDLDLKSSLAEVRITPPRGATHGVQVAPV